MSAALQMHPTKGHTREDDLESIVHVLTWICLRYMRNSLSANPETLRMRICELYEHKVDNGEGQLRTGGNYKEDFFIKPHYMADLSFHDNQLLTYLVAKLRILFCSRYASNLQSNTEPTVEGFLRKAMSQPQLVSSTPPRQEIKAEDLLKLFDQVLSRKDWPENDKAEDQLPEHLRGKRPTFPIGPVSDLDRPPLAGKRRHTVMEGEPRSISPTPKRQGLRSGKRVKAGDIR